MSYTKSLLPQFSSRPVVYKACSAWKKIFLYLRTQSTVLFNKRPKVISLKCRLKIVNTSKIPLPTIFEGQRKIFRKISTSVLAMMFRIAIANVAYESFMVKRYRWINKVISLFTKLFKKVLVEKDFSLDINSVEGRAFVLARTQVEIA